MESEPFLVPTILVTTTTTLCSFFYRNSFQNPQSYATELNMTNPGTWTSRAKLQKLKWLDGTSWETVDYITNTNTDSEQ